MNRIILIVIGILYSGCVSKGTNTYNITTPNILKVSLDNNNMNSQFKNKMIEIAKRSEMKYNQYTELLISLKKNNSLKSSRIPRNLGKRLSFSFDGYSLALVKKICSETGYNLLLKDIRLSDSRIISRDYENTMVVDMLEDISIDGGFNLEIDEAKMEIVARLN